MGEIRREDERFALEAGANQKEAGGFALEAGAT